MLSIGLLLHVDLEAEYLIVTHAHEVPGRVIGLAVVRVIPSTANDLLAADKVSDLQLVVPPHPAPVHAVFRWLLMSFNIRKLPMNTAIDRDLHTSDHSAASRVSISRNVVGLVNIGGNGKLFVVQRGSNSRVDIELVEDVLWLVPPSVLKRLLGGDVGRQDSVVMIVVVVLGFVRNDIDCLEPLDHATTDVSRNDQTDRVSVIREQLGAVGFKSDHDIVGRVHGTGKGN
mmetsp:Transcript_12928/g.37238  ORF Transcript_12928/g.37238 Transcript_12928/m.37238 type:complete len:229 (-) Transcript_12928:328-1014(-)